MNEQNKYIPATIPKFKTANDVITEQSERMWNRFGSQWEDERNQAAQKLIAVSPRLQNIAAEKGLDKAIYDARLTIIKGERDDDPEITLSERRVVLETLRNQSDRLCWRIYNPKSARQAVEQKYTTKPALMSLKSKGVSDLTPPKQLILQQIVESEKYGIVGYEGLMQQLQATEPLNLLTYSCLPTIPGKQEISPVLGEARFFKLYPGRIEPLFERLRRVGALDQVTLTVLMADDEPWRVWGWDEQNRAGNEPLIDELISLGNQKLQREIGINSRMIRYSEFFTDSTTRENLGYNLQIPKALLAEEINLYQRLPISVPNIPKTAVDSIYMYAAEGVELTNKPPMTIIGLETPVRQRDSVLNLGRWDNPQPIIHPVKFGVSE